MNIKATAMCCLPMEAAFKPHNTIDLKTEFIVFPQKWTLALPQVNNFEFWNFSSYQGTLLSETDNAHNTQ